MADVEPRWKNSGVPTVDDWPEARENRLYVDKGLCQVKLAGCGVDAFHVHHRRPSDRRMGDHALDRLTSCCLWCHGSVHANPDWSNRHGWLLRSGCEGEPFPGCELTCTEDHRPV